MTKNKRPANKWERIQVEKKYREKEIGNKAGRVRKRHKEFTQATEDEDDFSTLGLCAVR